jgi:hypothetical protein
VVLVVVHGGRLKNDFSWIRTIHAKDYKRVKSASRQEPWPLKNSPREIRRNFIALGPYKRRSRFSWTFSFPPAAVE